MIANISVAIIAKNAARTIAACLDSIVPYVEEVLVAVDNTSTDDTPAIAAEHGAKVIYGLKVSDWHECPQHGRVLAQHFANARQQSFELCRPDTAWWMWLDADDVVRGAEKLPELIAHLGPEVAGVWLDYHYSQTPNGKTATLFQRERIVRKEVGWAWQHRVHEVLAPKDRPTEHVNWTSTREISVVHQGEGHDTAGSAKRNILLLEIDLEADPQDMRALFYLGNQYFALGEFAEAAHYYERATASDNVYQRWQTWVYLSYTYEKLGNGGGAVEAAHHALETVPFHPEPYYRLAALSCLRGDTQACEFWTMLGDQREEAPFFAFKNPMDRPFNARITLAQAYGNDGQISKARQQLERAAAVVPSPDIVEGIKQYRVAEEETLTADAYLRVLAAMDGQTPPPPESIWKFGRVRDALVPKMLSARPNTQPRIAFWCGRSAEHWAPPSLNTTGIGGSETAVVKIAERFARDGWRVDVYNEPDYLEGEYEGVGYWGLSRLAVAETADVLVSWRNPEAHQLPVQRRLSLLWCHDLNRGPGQGDALGKWDTVLGVSAWHAAYLSQVYGIDNVDCVPNGIDLDRFPAKVKKVPFRCVYASSPDRGLARLLQMWPTVVANEPAAELHIAYGWETFDKYIQMGRHDLAQQKQEVIGLLERTPQVVWRGRLPQDELARLYQESYLWLYPTSFLEVSCISAMEAMAGGAVPVTSAAGALRETIGGAGLIVDGNTYTQAWKDFWCLCARSALLSPEVRLPLAAKGRERAKALSWDASYEQWKGITVQLLEGRKEASLEAAL